MNTITLYRNKIKRRKAQSRRNKYTLNDYGGLFYGWTYNNHPVEVDAITRGAYVQVNTQ